jgi:hypothetical protein
VRAAIGPGLFASVGIREMCLLSPQEHIPLHFSTRATIAFDGERDMVAGPGEHFEVALDLDGPWVVDPGKAMTEAVRNGGSY